MDRSWMYAKRNSTRYLSGIQEFSIAALNHQTENNSTTILCPCCDCNNSRGYRDIGDIKDHLIRRGFKENYTTWTWHGEHIGHHEANCSYCVRPDVTRCDGDNADQREDMDTADIVVENEDEVEKDRVTEMMHDVEDHFIDEPHIYDSILRAAETPLYPGCTKFTKLSGIMKLFNIKASNSLTDKSFTQILEAVVEMLPEGNELPHSTYEAKTWEHWVLLVLCMAKREVYVFDSIKRKRNLLIKDSMTNAFRTYKTLGGQSRGTKLSWISGTCPQQEGGDACGYYVMRYMFEILRDHHRSENLISDYARTDPYTLEEINEVRDLWEDYFVSNVEQ